MEGTAKLVAAARESPLVVFAGAGVSMAPPTNLPSWREFNGAVVRALADSAAPLVSQPIASRAAEVVLARHAEKKLPPEYQAQVLAETMHARYFEVLRHLDSDRPNPTHLAIAWLAREGCVRAVVTTNFDRALEAAFAAVEAPLERCCAQKDFRALASDPARLARRKGPCHLLKLHGSTEDPTTLVDTLAQRKRGLAPEVLDCVRALLRSSHWLFLGYSGLDLEADGNYLALRQESERAVGFTWLVRTNTRPLDVVVRLRESYGERAQLVTGELPAGIVELADALGGGAHEGLAKRAVPSAAEVPADASELERAVRAWAQRIPAAMCALALANVVMACAEPQAAAELTERLLETLEKRAETDAHARLFQAVAANTFGALLAGLGRHAEAVHWLELSVASAMQADDPDSADRARGNLAHSLETLGRIGEAREAYDAALAGYRSRGEPGPIAFGLTSLASHLMRQVRLDEARPLAEEAVRWATEAGDERMRGTALNDLGMIARLKGDLPRALEVLTEVEALFARLGNDEAVAAAASNRAYVLAGMGRCDEAEKLHLDALRVNERLERLDNVGSTCMGLGALASERGDPEGTKRWYTKAREIFHGIGDPSNEAMSMLRLAQMSLGLGAGEEAIATADAALPLVEGRNDTLASDLNDVVGKANLEAGYVVRAEQAYRKVAALSERLGNTRQVAAAMTNIGTALMLQLRDAEAEAAFAKAASLWSELGDEDSLAHCQLGRSAVNLAQRITERSNAARAATTREAAEACVNDAIELFPELIAKYDQLGAKGLVADEYALAANAAKLVGKLELAGRWYQEAGTLYETIGAPDRAQQHFASSKEMLRIWTNALIDNREFERALPDVLRLAEVAERLGEPEMCASALLNASMIILQTTRDYAQARSLAQRSLEHLPPDSDDIAAARAVISHCDGAQAR
jgi:tetratricopeptide (TPR) repeat protein/NAD-dependent SIR2 family protein deacetylase